MEAAHKTGRVREINGATYLKVPPETP